MRGADGSSTAFLCPHRHQGSRHSLPKVRLVSFGFLRGRNKFPPGDVLVFRRTALLATCRERQDAIDVESQFVKRNTERREEFEEQYAEVVQSLRTAGDPGEFGE